MKEFIDKLISRLEEYKYSHLVEHDQERLEHCTENERAEHCEGIDCFWCVWDKSIEIINELAEEYKDKSGIIEDVKAFLKEKFDYCAEQAEMNLEAECNSEIASYFRERKELYLDRANIYGEVMREIDRLSEEYKGGWIPCSERLPNEDKKVLCQGKNDVFIGFVDSFDGEWTDNQHYRRTNVKAWMPLPAPYTEGE